MRFVRFVLVILALLLASAVAQNAPSPAFKSGADLVLVPAVIQDKEGKHVSGLSLKDFVLEDNGAKQTIASVEEVSAQSAPTGPPAELAADVARGVLFTNQVAASSQPRELLIFAVDLINAPFVDTEQGRRAMLQFIAMHMTPNRTMGLVAIEPDGVRLLHAFTTSPAVLSAALNKVAGVTTTPASTQETALAQASAITAQDQYTAAQDRYTAALDRYFAGEYNRLTHFVADQQLVAGEKLNVALGYQAMNAARQEQAIATALESLRQIAFWVSGISGRKALVWLTGDIPLVTGQGNIALGKLGTAEYERTIKALEQANVALYPVDVRGVVPESMYNRAWLESRRVVQQTQLAMDSSPTGIKQRSEALQRGPEQEPDSHAAMNYLASLTGGRAYYNRNDIPRVLEEAALDSARYYVLSYYLDRSRSKPGWHKLKVTASREKVTVRARNGFFLPKPGQDESAKQQDEATALAAPFEYTALPVNLRWKDTVASGNKRRVNFEIYVPASAQLVGPDRNALDVDFIAAAMGEDRGVAARSSKAVRSQLKPEAQQQIETFGLTYISNLDVKPGDYSVRLVVRDNQTGRLGSITAPLHVAP